MHMLKIHILDFESSDKLYTKLRKIGKSNLVFEITTFKGSEIQRSEIKKADLFFHNFHQNSFVPQTKNEFISESELIESLPKSKIVRTDSFAFNEISSDTISQNIVSFLQSEKVVDYVSASLASAIKKKKAQRNINMQHF
jgi:hypothetical protein